MIRHYIGGGGELDDWIPDMLIGVAIPTSYIYSVLCNLAVCNLYKEEFEYTKEVVIIHKSKKNRQHNGQKVNHKNVMSRKLF